MLSKLPHKFLGLDHCLGQVSSNSENVQNLAILHYFIKTILFPFYTNLQLLLSLLNIPHKFLGVNQRLGQVSSNSKNVPHFAVLHGFIKASSFSFYTNLQLLLSLAYLPHKFLGLDQCFGYVSSNSENVQKFSCFARFYQSKFVSLLYKLVVIIRLSKFTTQILGS